MAGIYIHIPFCKQACTYCDFYFSTSSKMVDDLIVAIIKEIGFQKDYFKEIGDEQINTVYFGGGTPSIIKPKHLQNIIEAIRINYHVADEIECTIEVNPDDCSAFNIKAWQEMGINRVSCGVQSFMDRDLIFMNRTHTANEAESAIKRMQDTGLVNISIDLIYGLPNMSEPAWAANLNQAKNLEIAHLSCYSLTVEEKTVLAYLVKKQKVKLDEQAAARNFEYLMDWSAQNGFEHYEISNLCKKGFESKHNSAYWKGIPYLGIGPSAHSFNGNFRQHNPPNMFSYLKSLNDNKSYAVEEHLSFTEKYHEKIMIGLRLQQGISYADIQNYLDDKIEKHFKYSLNKHLEINNIVNFNDNFALSNQGKLIADYIIQDFFIA
jgi:oxygen-independent coproporphyrinogen III oxidase